MGLWGIVGKGLVKGIKWIARHPDAVKGAIDVAKGLKKEKARDPLPSADVRDGASELCMAPHPTFVLVCERPKGHESTVEQGNLYHAAVHAREGLVRWVDADAARTRDDSPAL